MKSLVVAAILFTSVCAHADTCLSVGRMEGYSAQITDGWILAKDGLSGVIPPFVTQFRSSDYAAFASFCIGVMPPMPMLGRS